MNVLREELKSVKDELDIVKEELKEIKSEQLEEINKTGMRGNNQEESSARVVICRSCDKTFDSKKGLKVHIKTTHPQHIKCKSCEEKFERNSELEVHIKEKHELNGRYECDKCDKTFALRWRLGKHKEGHASLKNKTCHYFNNKKVCPFEAIGCMFDHVMSEMCIYGKKCTQKLCSYQHEEPSSPSDESNEPADIIEINLKEQFEELTYKEQDESKMIVCDQLCKASHGYHRCNDEDYEGYKGCDVFNITDEFDDDNDYKRTEYFPCVKCDLMYDDFAAVKEHYLKDHQKESADGILECDECDFSTKSVEMLIMHIGVKHNEIVKKRLQK
jgi:hypothetical protein